jgi:hypothetical protein
MKNANKTASFTILISVMCATEKDKVNARSAKNNSFKLVFILLD